MGSLTVLEIIMGVILLLLAVALIVIVTIQQSKKSGLGQIIEGGSSDSYYGKNKGKSKEKILQRLTIIISVAMGIIVLALYCAHGAGSSSTTSSEAASSAVSEASATSETSTASEAPTASEASAEASVEAGSSAEEPASDASVEESSVA